MPNKFRSSCLLASMLDVLGDKWSLLIVRDMLTMHKKTFKELSESDERIAPSTLSARLKLLESYGLITKRKLPDNQKENIYLLTESGIDLAPVISEILLWSNKHMRVFNDVDDIAEGLDTNTDAINESVKANYRSMVKTTNEEYGS